MRLSCVLCSPRLFRHSAGKHSTIAIPTGYLRQAGRRERLRGLRVCRTETILVGGSEGGSNTGGYKVASAGAISAFAGNFFRRQRCQPALDSEHLAAREAIDNGVAHPLCELRANGGTSEVS